MRRQERERLAQLKQDIAKAVNGIGDGLNVGQVVVNDVQV
jgi:hypothetical protein